MQSQYSGSNRADGTGAILDPTESASVLGVLANEGCQEVLHAIGEETRSATEVSARVDQPMSSIYRHLDALEQAGLLESAVRINTQGRNQQEYSRAVDTVDVAIGEDVSVLLR